MTSAGSGGNQAEFICSGLTPAEWKRLAAQWPSPYYAVSRPNLGGYQATLFHCPTTGLDGTMFGDRTMLEVIDIAEGDEGNHGLGRYIVAALLNARAGRAPVLSEAAVRDMWNDLMNRGYYEPTAGVEWTAPEIITYLKTTMS